MSWSEKERAVEREDQKEVEQQEEIFTEVENMATKVEQFSKLVSRLLSTSTSDTPTKIKNKLFSDCFNKKKLISKELDILQEKVHEKNNTKLKLQLKKISNQFIALDGKLQTKKDEDIKRGHIKVKQSRSDNLFDIENSERGEEQIIWEDEEQQIQQPKSQLSKTQEATLNVERLIALETKYSVQELEEEMKELQSKFEKNSFLIF